MSRVIPLNSMLNPTSKPSAHLAIEDRLERLAGARVAAERRS